MGTTIVTPTLYSNLDAKLPMVMLPVRIETRYFASGANLELRIRVFPSAAHVTTDRPSPDQVEHDETVAYWSVRESKGDSDPATAAAWQRMTSLFGDARAQWLRRTLTPTKAAGGSLTFPNVAITPAAADGSFLASEATALPTRFIVSGFTGATRVFAYAGLPVPDSVAVGPHGDPKAIAWQTDFKTAEGIGLGLRIPLTRGDAVKLTRLYVYGVREGAGDSGAQAALEDLLQRHVRGDGASLMRAGTPTNNTTDTPAPAPPEAPDKTPISGTDGWRIAQALGVDAGIFAGIGGSDAVTDQLVTDMHIALWPATFEYFLKQVMAPVVDDLTAKNLQGQFISYVRPRGPFASLRLGSQPYGILPVTTSANWNTAAGTVINIVMKGLHTLAPTWLAAAAHAPRLGGTSDAGSDVISVLSQSPVSRRWTGRVTESHLIAGRNFEGADSTKYTATLAKFQQQKRAAELTPLGITGTPLALDFIFRASTFDINLPLVAPADADRSAPLAANYIAGIATASSDALKSETIAGTTPRSLLYMFLRHATLLKLSEAASTILTKPALSEAVFIESTSDTVWTRLNAPVASLGNKSVGQALTTTLTTTVPTQNATLLDIRLHQQALKALAAVPVGELERLTADAIDAASYRLDAWLTAQATSHLHSMRTTAPTGLHLGAYGWVDAPAVPAVAATDGVAAVADPTSEGFLHGARLEHARTAAILRAAYLNRANDGAQAQYAIDLSSDRVRLARQIVSEVQAGANLSELLGARVERLMVEHNLGPLLQGLRTQFPLDTGDGRQRIDGVLLAQSWQKTVPANLQAVATVLLSTIDAVGDLLLAEAVHQQASGSAGRARIALSALETGTALPADFDVLRTQPDAVNTTWRLILPVAESGLDAWIASLVGDPGHLTASVAQTAGAPHTVTVASLGITAKGLLDYAQETPDAPALASKFADAAGGGAVTFSPALENALVVSHALSLLMRNARPLSTQDLGDVARTPITDFDAASALSQWLHDVGRVRQPIQAVGLLDAALAARGSALTLKFASAGPQLTLVTIGDWPDASATGTLLDGWNEITSGVQAATGVAVHYNAPRSRPPQAILLLVPPLNPAAWDVFGVEAILAETADLAKMRMVRPADVHGSFLPALYFADNLQADTVSTDFLAHAVIFEVKQ